MADTRLSDPLSMASARLALDTALQYACNHGWRVSVAKRSKLRRPQNVADEVAEIMRRELARRVFQFRR